MALQKAFLKSDTRTEFRMVRRQTHGEFGGKKLPRQREQLAQRRYRGEDELSVF